jgi:phenylpyruvate tautomerase PptA (4-oxalocrotonate tautomerase family)
MPVNQWLFQKLSLYLISDVQDIMVKELTYTRSVDVQGSVNTNRINIVLGRFVICHGLVRRLRKVPETSKGDSNMPVVFIEAPPGIHTDVKKKMVEKITSAIDEAYHIGDTLVFLREYAPDNVAMDGRLQSENPKILEALKQMGS